MMISQDFRAFDHSECPRCGEERYGGSHYHCGNCSDPQETSMLGHFFKDFEFNKHGKMVTSSKEAYFHCKPEYLKGTE